MTKSEDQNYVSLSESEMDNIIGQILGMSIGNKGSKTRAKSGNSVEPFIEGEGFVLIKNLKKMIEYERLSEVKKKSAMVS